MWAKFIHNTIIDHLTIGYSHLISILMFAVFLGICLNFLQHSLFWFLLLLRFLFLLIRVNRRMYISTPLPARALVGVSTECWLLLPLLFNNLITLLTCRLGFRLFILSSIKSRDVHFLFLVHIILEIIITEWLRGGELLFTSGVWFVLFFRFISLDILIFGASSLFLYLLSLFFVTVFSFSSFTSVLDPPWFRSFRPVCFSSITRHAVLPLSLIFTRTLNYRQWHISSIREKTAIGLGVVHIIRDRFHFHYILG